MFVSVVFFLQCAEFVIIALLNLTADTKSRPGFTNRAVGDIVLAIITMDWDLQVRLGCLHCPSIVFFLYIFNHFFMYSLCGSSLVI